VPGALSLADVGVRTLNVNKIPDDGLVIQCVQARIRTARCNENFLYVSVVKEIIRRENNNKFEERPIERERKRELQYC